MPVVPIQSRFGVPVVPVVQIWSAACVASCRFRRVDSVASIRSRRFGRFGRVASCRSCRFGALLVSRRVETRGANTKKARFLNRGIGLSYRKASRALNLLSVPLSNTCASARSVRLGLARRFGRFRSCRVAIWHADCADSVAIWRAGRVGRAGRAGRADLERCLCRVAIWRAGRAGRVETRGANTKKSPIPQSGNRAQLSQGVARS